MQNTPEDLWSLFNFLMPGYLSTKTSFYSRFAKRILMCRNPKATEEQIREGEVQLDQLHRQCEYFFI